MGDVKNVLCELNKIVTRPQHDDWLAQLTTWKREKPLTYQKSETKIKPQQVIQEICAITQGEAIITTSRAASDVGRLVWHYLHPRSFISSGGLGVMRIGFYAMMGPGRAPGKTGDYCRGDGSFQMVVQELATAVCGDFPVKVVILNNGFLGMLRQWQDLFFEKRLCHTCLRHVSGKYFPDFVKLAEAYNAVGIRIEQPAELRPKLEEAFAIPRPVIIDGLNEEEKVFPMVLQAWHCGYVDRIVRRTNYEKNWCRNRHPVIKNAGS